MKIFSNLIFLFAIFSASFLQAQNSENNKIALVGSVMDKFGSPVKGAMVFIDSVNTNVQTNKKGFYKIEVDSTAKLLTVFSKKYGLLSMHYSGQKKVGFFI